MKTFGKTKKINSYNDLEYVFKEIYKANFKKNIDDNVCKNLQFDYENGMSIQNCIESLLMQIEKNNIAKQKVKFVTYDNLCGISVALKRYRDSIIQNYDCTVCDLSNFKSVKDNDITIIFRVCDKDTEDIIIHEKNNKIPTIGIFVWELHTLHKDFINVCKLYDHIIVPNFQLKSIFEDYNFNNVTSIYHSICTQSFSKKSLSINNIIDKHPNSLIFYTICTNSFRKNVEFLIDGFNNFIKDKNEKPILIVKIDSIPKEYIKCKNVYFIQGNISNEELIYLHEKANCYLCTSFSEGVNLPMIDACYNKNIIISTHFGGSTEYFPYSFTINGKLTSVLDDYYYFSKDDCWIQPSMDHYLYLLNYVFSNFNDIYQSISHIQKKHIEQICCLRSNGSKLDLVIKKLLK